MRSKLVSGRPGMVRRVRARVVTAGLVGASVAMLTLPSAELDGAGGVGVASAHENRTTRALIVALNSCSNHYAPGSHTCQYYGEGPDGPHSYKFYMAYTDLSGLWCHAAFTMGHSEVLIESHFQYCAARV